MSGVRCPTPHKRKLSESAALKAALSLSRKVGYGIRPYLCICGRWHITRWKWETKSQNVESGTVPPKGQ